MCLSNWFLTVTAFSHPIGDGKLGAAHCWSLCSTGQKHLGVALNVQSYPLTWRPYLFLQTTWWLYIVLYRHLPKSPASAKWHFHCWPFDYTHTIALFLVFSRNAYLYDKITIEVWKHQQPRHFGACSGYSFVCIIAPSCGLRWAKTYIHP